MNLYPPVARANIVNTPRVAIIGCGFGGIGAAVKLVKAGITSFTIFERSDGPGGVWWDNRYPGAEVDVPSSAYSFSFMNYDWTRTHARQHELQQYMEDVLDTFGLRAHCRFGTAIRRAVWNDDNHVYALSSDRGPEGHYDVVISAIGTFSSPQVPRWPGLDDFERPHFHTSRWEHHHDLTGKRVAVVGTGSTACQLVPAIAPTAARLFLFQREPAWVLPKVTRDLSDEERKALRRPFARRLQRLKVLLAIELPAIGGRRNRPSSRVNRSEEQRCRAFIDSVFRHRPDLMQAVTPTHPFSGKRPVQNDNFYESLLRDDVELIPHAVTRLTKTGVVDDVGVEREVDILVMATGFQAAAYLADLEVVGRNGRHLQDIWQGEPEAFLGITVAGVPNFYMIHGPNTSSVNLITTFEHQADFVVRHIRRMMKHGISSIEVRQRVMDRYNVWLQRRLAGTAWTTTRNYYKSPSGKIVTQWPDGALLYGLLTKAFSRIPAINHHRRRSMQSEPARPTGDEAIGDRASSTVPGQETRAGMTQLRELEEGY